jgi:hypothetical protein
MSLLSAKSRRLSILQDVGYIHYGKRPDETVEDTVQRGNYVVDCTMEDRCKFHLSDKKAIDSGRVLPHLIFDHNAEFPVTKAATPRRLQVGSDSTDGLSVLSSFNDTLASSPSRSTSVLTRTVSRNAVNMQQSQELEARMMATFLARHAIPHRAVCSHEFKELAGAIRGNPYGFNYYPQMLREHTSGRAAAVRLSVEQKLLGNMQYITVAIDGWTNTRGEKVTNVVLLCQGFAWYWTSIPNLVAKDSAEWLTSKLIPILRSLRSKGMKLVAVVSDNASTMIKVRSELCKEHSMINVPCGAHTLQLAVKAIFKINYFKQQVVEWINYINIYRSNRELRVEVNNKSSHKLVYPNDTRWNSVYDALKRLNLLALTLREVANNLDQVNYRTQLRPYNITRSPDQWAALSDILVILEPFAVATDKIQRNSATLITVHNAFNQINNVVSSWQNTKPFAYAPFNTINWREEINTILHNQWSKHINKTAVYLVKYFAFDPKRLSFASEVEEGSVKNMLAVMIQRTVGATVGSTPNSRDSAADDSEENSTEDKCSDEELVYRQWVDFILNSAVWTPQPTDNSNDSLRQYWMQRITRPHTSHLAYVAWAMLGIAPSEAAVERSFSQQKHIHTAVRNRLSSDSVEDAMMIRMNLPLLDPCYQPPVVQEEQEREREGTLEADVEYAAVDEHTITDLVETIE